MILRFYYWKYDIGNMMLEYNDKCSHAYLYQSFYIYTNSSPTCSIEE